MPKLINIGSRQEEALTPEELAERWGRSVGHLANMRAQGKGCGYFKPTDREVWYPLSEVITYEEARLVTPEIRD